MSLTLDPNAIFVAEIDAYVPNDGTVQTFYFATHSWSTTSSDTPADTYVPACLKQTAVMSRTMFGAATTRGRSTIGYGDLVLDNGDGELDEFFKYGFDGQRVTIRRGPEGGDYPADFVTDLVATMGGRPEVLEHTLVFKLRDRQAELDKPLQTQKYVGDNANSFGLEGGSDLAGKPKPIVYGAVRNIAPPCVNPSKLIYQVHDGEVSSVDGVYDRGMPLTAGFPLTLRAAVLGGADVRDAIYANERDEFVIVGTGDQVSTSTDGITWTSPVNALGGGSNIWCITYGAGLYVVGGDAGKIATSPDAITWTSRTSGFGGSDAVNGIHYANGLFVAVGGRSGVSIIATSPDGITWTLETSAGSNPKSTVVFGHGVWVAAGTAGELETATDPTGTWTARTSQFSTAGSSVVYNSAFGAGRFVIVGSDGQVATSEDGYAWALRTSGYSSHIRDVFFVGSYFVMVTTGGNNSTSTNGLIWINRRSGTTGNFISVTASPAGTIVVGGAGGTLFSSTDIVTYASAEEVLNDEIALAPGGYGVYTGTEGTYIRLGAQPAGLVTMDVTQGTSAADRTTAQVFAAILEERAGLTSSDYSAGDLTSLDAAADYVIGYWTASETQIARVLDEVAGSVGASWFVDKDGVFRIKQLLAPTGTASATITANKMFGPPRIVQSNDPGRGLPPYETTVRYARNYAPMSSDIAPGVEASRRVELEKEWLEETERYESVLDAHPLAIQSIRETLLADEDDAQAEATRLQELHLPRRDCLEIKAHYDEETAEIDLHDEIKIVHERYGLNRVSSEDGPTFRVLGIEPNAKERTITFTLWGTADLPANLIDDDGAYFVDDDGAYFILEAA